ncbi:hypothetical protein ABIE18_001870 [Arthrobacter sp. 2762]
MSAEGESEITSHFKFIAKIVLGLTATSGVTYLGLVLFVQDPSADVRTLMTIASAGWTSGTGAFFGLLGGKAIQ